MVTIDTISPSNSRQQARNGFLAGFVPRFTLSFSNPLAWIARRLELRRSRLDLLELSDDQLKDIGLSRSDAYREGLRSWWD